jgi:hypothetical protein
MALYNEHDQFVEDICHGVHDLTATTGDALTAYLTNTAPIAADAVYGDLTSPVEANISTRVFPAGTRASGQITGTYTLLLPDLILTATGAVADFRYIGVYNDDPTSPADPLICWWDYGVGGVTGMVTDDTFTITFTDSTFTIAPAA